MKSIIIMLSLICIQFTTHLTNNNPVNGELFKIKYDVSTKKIFEDPDKITLIYAFDYWGTKVSYASGPEGLFQNILDPDSGRANQVEMIKKGKFWSTEIKIPESVSLLSYYFTDGDKIDANDSKTFVKYIYGNDNKPVKSARFRNIDFMKMAGKSNKEQIAELQNEILDYPTYFQAYIPLWRTKFETAQTLNELFDFELEFENRFNDLKNIFGDSDSLRLAEASIYYAVLPNISRITMTEYERLENKIIPIVENIPVEIRSNYLSRFYDGYKKRNKSKKLNNKLIGMAAPDFNFITLDKQNKSLSDYKGKFILLDFWGTWCGPCVAEIPKLKNAYTKFSSKGFEVISISSDKRSQNFDLAKFENFIEEKGMVWTQVLDEKMKIHDLYNIVKWPSLYLIDKDGKVLKIDKGLRGAELMKTLEKIIKQ